MRFTMTRESYLPEDAVLLPNYGTDAAVYVFDTHRGKPAAVGFHGKAQKPDFNNLYTSEEHRAKTISGFIQGRKSHAESMVERKAKRTKPHSFKVGDILYSSWGYDQTNIDFYQVIGTTKRTVVIRKIGGKTTSSNPPIEHVVADPGNFIDEPMKKVVNNDAVRIASYAWAYLWDGTPKYETSFGWGH